MSLCTAWCLRSIFLLDTPVGSRQTSWEELALNWASQVWPLVLTWMEGRQPTCGPSIWTVEVGKSQGKRANQTSQISHPVRDQNSAFKVESDWGVHVRTVSGLHMCVSTQLYALYDTSLMQGQMDTLTHAHGFDVLFVSVVIIAHRDCRCAVSLRSPSSSTRNPSSALLSCICVILQRSEAYRVLAPLQTGNPWTYSIPSLTWKTNPGSLSFRAVGTSDKMVTDVLRAHTVLVSLIPNVVQSMKNRTPQFQKSAWFKLGVKMNRLSFSPKLTSTFSLGSSSLLLHGFCCLDIPRTSARDIWTVSAVYAETQCL